MARNEYRIKPVFWSLTYNACVKYKSNLHNVNYMCKLYIHAEFNLIYTMQVNM